MSDLISRQAAIKAVVDGLSIKPSETVVRGIIEAVPAADNASNALDVLDTRWIPVSEGKPKDGIQVLATAWEDTLLIGYFDNDGKEFVTDEFTLDLMDTDFLGVTAWRPLPEPYKGVNDEV